MQNLPKICAFGAFHFNLLQNPQNPNFCRDLITVSREAQPLEELGIAVPVEILWCWNRRGVEGSRTGAERGER